jgi:hypothetical protein
MSDQIPYLSDEELEKLIAGAEAETIIKAPDDLEDKVIARIESSERKKTVDFATYCLRVGFGVAAAIALLTIVPSVPERQFELPTKDTVLVEKEIPTREEVLGNKTVLSKEEVLNGEKEPRLIDEIKNYFD